MITNERIQELIVHYEDQLVQIDSLAAGLFGGLDNPVMEATRNIAKSLTIDTIAALQEYQSMASMKNMIDGGTKND